MMQTTIKFDDNSKEVVSRIAVFSDTLMALMAANIEIQAKTGGRTPFLHGALRSSIRSQKVSVANYKVTAGTGSSAAAYAAAQEAGTTRGFPMRNYTTPGTGAGWFKGAISTVLERSVEYIETAKNTSGLGVI